MNKILLTGASGFLGQHLLNYNHKNKLIEQSKFLLLSSKNIDGYNTLLHNNWTFTKDEIKENINTVIHLASFCPKVRADINNIKENIKTITTLEYLLKNLPNLPKKIVYISTISVYGHKLINYSERIDEKTQTSPDFLYGHAKLMSEEILKEFCKNNHIKLCLLRLGVSYGENDDLRRGTIPTIVKSILKNEELTVYNNGEELRHFVHTDDISRMILEASLNETSQLINIVDNSAIKISELIHIVEKIYNKKANIKFAQREQINDSLFNNKEMTDNFGDLKISVEKGLKGVCEYYQKNL